MLRICLACLVFVFWSTDGLSDISNPAAASSTPVDLRVHNTVSSANQLQPEFRSQPDSPRDNSRRRPKNQRDKVAARIRNKHGVQYYSGGKLSRKNNLTDTLNYPYMAAVMINGRLWCAGAIVDVGWVLTAAHCLNYVLPLVSAPLNRYVKVREGSVKPHEGGDLMDVTVAVRHPKFKEPVPVPPTYCLTSTFTYVLSNSLLVLSVLAVRTLNRYVKVRVGSVKPHEGGELVDVTGAVRHPKFEEEPVPHADVALLKLQRNLEFSKYINLIRVYDGSREPFAQSFVSVAGWGATSGSATAFREQTSTMLVARLKVRTQHYCEDAYQLVNGFQFDQDMFCTSLRNGTRDVCLFDAGAPAIQHNALMGIMSFGPERCGGTQPAVFIKALYFRDFVKHTIVQYKTTGDLIEAVKEAEDNPRPPMMN